MADRIEIPPVPSVEAIEYGQRAVGGLRDRLRRWEKECAEKGDDEGAEQWRRMANLIEMRLLGGSGCVITAFDDRWLDPTFRTAMAAARGEGDQT